MAQSTPTNSYCSRASFRCAYMHHIEKYVFQQESVAPGSGLLLGWEPPISITYRLGLSRIDVKAESLTEKK